jgi:Uma2 family endonuclease
LHVITSTPISQQLLLTGIDWPTYRRLARVLTGRPGVRLTYDRGRLEIMTLSPEHERIKHLIRRLLEALSEEVGQPIAGFGSMTFRRRRKLRSLEPDECYWVAHEAAVRGKDHIDLRHDPAPDLCVEIDITHSSLDRLGIYALLGVPEVWRFDGTSLRFLALQPDGSYQESASSLAFPRVAPADLMRFLNLRGTTDENSITQQLRAWVRQQRGTP